MFITLRIALRYLLARKSHSAVNVISLISMAGVAVATMAMVCVMSVFNGFSDIASARMSLFDAELAVTPASGKTIADGDSLAEALAAIPGVAMAMPVVEDQALAIYHNRQIPVTVKGVPDGYRRMVAIDSAIIDGVDLDIAAATDSLNRHALVGVGVALTLGTRPAYYDPLVICTPRRTGRYNPANPAASFLSDSLVVAGVFEINQPEYDSDHILVPIDVARELLDYYTEATAVEVAVAPGASLSDVEQAIVRAAGPDMTVTDRAHRQEDTFRMINIEKWVTMLMLAFILVIASFNIISTLSMIIIDKEQSIALLRVMGASASMTRRIFMVEGWLVSLGGCVAGIILGVVLTLAQQWGGFIKFAGDPALMVIDAYPVRLAPADLLVVLAVTALIGLVTGLLATRLVPDRPRLT